MKIKKLGISIALAACTLSLAACGTRNTESNDSTYTPTPEISGGDTGKDTDTTTGGDTGKDTDTTTGGDTGKDTDTTTGGDTGKDIDTTTGGDTGKDTDKTTGGDTGKDTDTTTGGDTGKDTDTTTGGETGKDTDTTTGGDTGKDKDTTSGNTDKTNSELEKLESEVKSTSMTITKVKGDQESAYIEFNPVAGATNYKVYVKKTKDAKQNEVYDSYKEVDQQLIRKYKSDSTYKFRCDALGLAAGVYSMKVTYTLDGKEVTGAEATNIGVVKHIREGYAFQNASGSLSASGAYNDDGTLRSNAVVVYVSNDNKDTVTARLGGTEYKGVQTIIGAMKGGKNGTTPIDIRFLGNITDPSTLTKGDLYVDDVETGITIEGVGNDATMNGFGIVVKNSSYFEIRNLGFMNCDSSEGDDCGLQQANNHGWIHDNDFFYGDAGSDADQVKGDGALDTKKSTYITHSFNHFWDNGKCNLQGMKSETTENYITYHHNWYDHSDSRHPRIRTCTVHIYNNYFDGNAKYGVGVTMGASAFVENNYFRNCKDPMMSSGQGTDAKGDGTFSGETGGIIKAYNNKIVWEGAMADCTGNLVYANAAQGSVAADATSFDAYLASSRDEQVPSSYKTLSGGTTYNNFDTSSSFYTYNVEDPDTARDTVQKYAGRTDGGDFQWTFDNSVDDTSYAVNTELKAALSSYKNTDLLEVLGIDKASSSTDTTGGDTSGDTTVTTTSDDVIAMINALPDSTAVTASNRAAIVAARASYNSLTTDEQAKVTNLANLVACETALAALPQTAETLTFNGGATGDNAYFTVSANLKTGIASKTYNGETYTTAIKMETSTSIKFSTTQSVTVTIITDTASKKIKVNGTAVTTDTNGVATVTLTSGDHTITKGDSVNVYAIIVE